MQSESDKLKISYFIGTLAVLAILINLTVASRMRRNAYPTSIYASRSVHQPSQGQSAEEQRARNAAERAEEVRRAAQAAAEEHARFLSRYVSGGPRTPGTAAIALVAATENRRSNHGLGEALVQRLNNRSVNFLPTFFRPEFVSDGLFNEAFNEPSGIPQKLELAKSLDGLLVARQMVEYTTNDDLQGVITAAMRLEVLALPMAENAQRQLWTFAAYGSGFKEIDARTMAEERLAKQISKDTKMSLSPFGISNPNQ